MQREKPDRQTDGKETPRGQTKTIGSVLGPTPALISLGYQSAPSPSPIILRKKKIKSRPTGTHLGNYLVNETIGTPRH